MDSCECQDELGNFFRVVVGNFFLSLSCIGQPLWDLCEYQVITEATADAKTFISK